MTSGPPSRQRKPRRVGLSVVIDPGAATGLFEDRHREPAALIDFVKFGWGTALVTRELERKILCLRRNTSSSYSAARCSRSSLLQGPVRRLPPRSATGTGCRGGRGLERDDPDVRGPRRRVCRALRSDFEVISEVGFKDSGRSGELTPADWVECIREDLEAAPAGADRGRESGRSGICTPDGRPRQDAVEAILGLRPGPCGGSSSRRPRRTCKAYFVRRVGPEVNVGNVAMADVGRPGDAALGPPAAPTAAGGTRDCVTNATCSTSPSRAGTWTNAHRFYVEQLGCKLDRPLSDRITLDFFGTRSCATCPTIGTGARTCTRPLRRDVPRGGTTSTRLLGHSPGARCVPFSRDVQTRFNGLVEEHLTFVLRDPSNNPSSSALPRPAR